MSWTSWVNVQGEGLDFSDIIYEKKFHKELKGGVARISINRPERYNACTDKTFDELFNAIYDASHDLMIGAVVLTGVGDHFGTGGDVVWETTGARNLFYWRFSPDRALRMCRKPVIAAVKGYCIGGSNHLAYVADFTIASDDAIFGQNGPRVSAPADGYFIPYLTRVIGSKRAREMWMLCRRYTASEAHQMGLVNTVVPRDRLDDEVDSWCEEILSVSPGVLEVLKAAFDQELDRFPEAGVLSSMLYHDWFDSPEGKEGPKAFTEKRPPKYWDIRENMARLREQAWRDQPED